MIVRYFVPKGCTSTNSQEIKDFLMTKDSETILKSFSMNAVTVPWIDGKVFKDSVDILFK